MKCEVLVTGGAGFIGSHVTEHLLRRGHSVLVLDDLSGGFRENVPGGARFVEGSIHDPGLLRQLFVENGFQFVFHLAAFAAESLSHFARSFTYQNNLVGSVNLINASINAATVKCFVFSSSIAVYGLEGVAASEEMTPQPKDPYGIAKYAVELDLFAARRVLGLNYIIFRPHNVYGERQNLADPYRNVIGIFMKQAMRREKLTIFGSGNQQRPFTHIASIAPAIAESIERPAAYNQVFNLGADEVCTVAETARIVTRAFGAPLDVLHLPERPELETVRAAHQKARQHFGDLTPEIPLNIGIDRMAAWARQAAFAPEPPRRNLEVLKNLPPSWVSILQETARGQST